MLIFDLARKSLIHRTPAGRFEVHELLRQYGEEKLEASPAAAEAARTATSWTNRAAIRRALSLPEPMTD